MLAWNLNGAMDREVCATRIEVTVENTGINVVLGEVMQKINYNKFWECVHL